jgi:DNA-binding HxlR family transcriptional regulator
VCGGIQPDLLPSLADAAQREDGFLDRLLWSYPDPVTDRWTTDGIKPEALRAVETIFDDLQALEPDRDENDEPVARVIRLSPEAQALWVSWYDRHAAEMTDDGFQRRLRGPWAKLPGQLARLTLILHALVSRPPEAEVHPGVVEGAIQLLDYFKRHARRVYRQLARQGQDRVVVLLRALKTRGPMAQSVILHEVFQRNVSAAWLRSTLDDLEEAGLVTRETRQGEVGRPATIWAAT